MAGRHRQGRPFRSTRPGSVRQDIVRDHVAVDGSFQAALQGFDKGPEVDNAHGEEAEKLDRLDADGIREHMKRVVRIRTPWDVDDLANRCRNHSFPCQQKEFARMLAELTVFEHNRIILHLGARSVSFSRDILSLWAKLPWPRR